MDLKQILSMTLEEMVDAVYSMASSKSLLLEALALEIQGRVEELDLIYKTRFKRFCEINPLVQYWEGLEFFESPEQRLEHRQLSDALHYCKEALRGEPRKRILIRRSLRKKGVQVDSDLSAFRLQQLADAHGIRL